MKNLNKPLAWILLALFVFAAAACSSQSAANMRTSYLPMVGGSQLTEMYTDPFAYCAAAGTISKPEEHYTGEPVPDVIVQGYLKAAGLQDNPEMSDHFKKATIWRCMNRLVYACNFGANLPCESPAKIDKTPAPEMADFCKQNKNAGFIPMAVTGHDTIYAWRCKGNTPVVDKQINHADDAGFIAEIWHKIEQ